MHKVKLGLPKQEARAIACNYTLKTYTSPATATGTLMLQRDYASEIPVSWRDWLELMVQKHS